MSEPIKVGDLVQVVRGHKCFMEAKGGMVFVVQKLIHQTGGGWRCPKCLQSDIATSDMWGARAGWSKTPGAIPLSWLKKIPHLKDLEGVKQDEEITA